MGIIVFTPVVAADGGDHVNNDDDDDDRHSFQLKKSAGRGKHNVQMHAFKSFLLIA